MRRLAVGFLGVVVVCVVSAVSSFADSPYTTEVKGDIESLVALSKDLNDTVVRRASPVRTFSAMRLSFAAKGLGQVRLVLNDVTHKSWDSYVESITGKVADTKDVILVNGYVIGSNGKRHPVGGSIYSSKGHPRLFLIIQGNKKSKRSAYVRVRLDAKSKVLPARISTLPDSAMRDLKCDGDGVPALGSAASDSVGTRGTTTGQAVIATDTDAEYYAAYGADTNAHIATIVSAASAIYRSNLGIRLVLGTQHTFSSSSPYVSTASGALLTEFQNYTRTNHHLGDADAYHLFSGKDFDSSVIGLAYVAVVCEYPDYAYGTTQKYHPDADASIFAHELGHNFGASHDTTDSNSLMAPYVRIPGATYFSAASISAIQSHLSSSDSCLDAISGDDPDAPGAQPTPTPDPDDPTTTPTTNTKASINRKGVLDLRMTVSAVQAGCALQLYGSTSEFTNGKLVTEITPDSTVSRVRVTGLRRPRSGATSLFFHTEYVCADDSSVSEAKEANLNVITSRTSQRVGGVLNAIVNAFKSQNRRNKRI